MSKQTGGGTKGTLVVDIDGTICSDNSRGAPYSDLYPRMEVVEKLKEYKAAGFYITLFTARNMRTHEKNLGRINKFTAPVLHSWLEKWRIPYDEILFGKPWPGFDGFYIDDKSIRPSEFVSLNPEEILARLDAENQPLSENAYWAKRDVNIVITMAGLGSRFRKAGYDLPKYQIEVKGRTLFDWSMLSLSHFITNEAKIIFVVLKQDEATSFIKESCKGLNLPTPHIIELDELTDGQATSVLKASEAWDENAPLLIYNIDTHCHPAALKPEDIPANSQGWIPCFPGEGDHWSFVKLGDDGWAEKVAEKTRISDHATVGLYWFSSALAYRLLYQASYVDGNMTQAGEKYIAPMYEKLIQSSGKVAITSLAEESVQCLGTPEQVDIFAQNTYDLKS